MQSWIVSGVVASLIWGTYIVLLKVATSKLRASVAFCAMTSGILVTSITTFLWKGNGVTFPMPETNWALLAGLAWGIGMGFVTHAVSLPPTAVSRLTPLYNVNTLVAVILGVFLLKEIPELTKIAPVLAGAILVVVGGYLVTKEPNAQNESNATMRHIEMNKILGIQKWVICGVIAILMWGVYIVLLKQAVSPQYYGMEPSSAFLMMTLGILVTSLITFLVERRSKGNFSKSGFLTISLWPFIKPREIRLSSFQAGFIALISGILWGIAMLFVIHALSDLQAFVAKLTPLYNTNTLVAVLLGFGFLAEGRNLKLKQILFILFGAVCVMLGGWLVSM